MADNDLEIEFGADVAGLVSGTSQAKSELDKLLQSISILQRTVSAAARVTTTELKTAIEAMAANASATAPRVRQLRDDIERLSTAGHSGHGTIFGMQTGVFLELRALLDESLAGRMRNFEGSFARLLGLLGPTIGSFISLNPVLAGAGIAAAAAGGAFARICSTRTKRPKCSNAACARRWT